MSERRNELFTSEHIKHLIPQDEATTVKFKLRSDEAYKMRMEMVAFSNTQGRIFIISIKNNKTNDYRVIWNKIFDTFVIQ